MFLKCTLNNFFYTLWTFFIRSGHVFFNMVNLFWKPERNFKNVNSLWDLKKMFNSKYLDKIEILKFCFLIYEKTGKIKRRRNKQKKRKNKIKRKVKTWRNSENLVKEKQNWKNTVQGTFPNLLLGQTGPGHIVALARFSLMLAGVK